MNPMMLAQAGAQAAGALTSIASGIIGGGARRREQRAAQQEFDKEMAGFRSMDTSNLAAGMQNTFEDLTVNQQQAQFEAQQQQQGLANTLGAMQGAAGGSGIAALAQAMAGQQSANLQRASASIGQQEAANQMAAAKGAQRVQEMQYAGAEQARDLAQSKQTQLLGMAMERKGAADQARLDARQAIVGGIGEFFGAGATAAAGGAFGDIGGGGGSAGSGGLTPSQLASATPTRGTFKLTGLNTTPPPFSTNYSGVIGKN